MVVLKTTQVRHNKIFEKNLRQSEIVQNSTFRIQILINLWENDVRYFYWIWKTTRFCIRLIIHFLGNTMTSFGKENVDIQRSRTNSLNISRKSVATIRPTSLQPSACLQRRSLNLPKPTGKTNTAVGSKWILDFSLQLYSRFWVIRLSFGYVLPFSRWSVGLHDLI